MATSYGITDASFAQAMRDVVAERGEDYVYPRTTPGWHVYNAPGACRYVTTGSVEGGKQAACLIGAALHKLGVPLTRLARYDSSSLNSAGDVLHRAVPTLSDETRHAADAAQKAQDEGDTWGEALELFEQQIGD